MRKWSVVVLLILPAVFFMAIFAGALLTIVVQSFQTYTPGRIVQEPYVFTLENYRQYFAVGGPYLGFLLDTLRISAVATALSVILAYPLAYKISRTASPKIRKTLLIVLVASFFTSTMVKVFSIMMFLGDNGVLNSLLKIAGLEPIRFLGSEAAVVIGLIYTLFALAALALIGPIGNVSPTLEDAALNLGASRIQTFFKVTLPLSMPGIVAATLLTYALAVSSFIIPLFLGRGSVTMMSVIIYRRFSDSFNYPGGSAMSVIVLVTTLSIAYGLTRILSGGARRPT